MPASVPSPLLSTLPIQLLYSPLPSCLALWPASLTAEQACFHKAAVKRGESRYGRSWGLFRRSKILHRSVYSALWLGGLRCQCRRQTNGPLTARCPCWWSLAKKKKKICRPLQCVGPPGKCPVCLITSPALSTTLFKGLCLLTQNILELSMTKKMYIHYKNNQILRNIFDFYLF